MKKEKMTGQDELSIFMDRFGNHYKRIDFTIEDDFVKIYSKYFDAFFIDFLTDLVEQSARYNFYFHIVADYKRGLRIFLTKDILKNKNGAC